MFSSVFATKRQMQAMPNVSAGDDFMENLRTKILNDRNSRILASQNQGFSFRRAPAFAYGFSSVMVLVIAGFIFLQIPTTGNSTATEMPVAAQEKIEDAKTFQQQFDATPEHLKSSNLANTKVDSGKAKSDNNLGNFENNLNKVDYQKK